MRKIIYKLLLCMLPAFCMFLSASAQYVTTLTITDLDNAGLKGKIEKNITSLLSEFNTAQANGKLPAFNDCIISERAKSSILSLWENTPFRCSETSFTQKCLNSIDGYQVRNISLWMMPDDPDTFGEDRYQEAVINFNTQGEITNFQLAISNNLYTQVIKKNASVKDMRCRQMILDYVEQFRTAYNTKDMEFLEQIFSEDALIITGKVVKRQSVEKGFGFMGDKAKVEYSVQSKKQYLGRLANVFRNNKRIHVVFDEIKVYAHPAKENYYGVLLKQGYSSDSYSDIGYLFLLWDFNNEAGPKIHVRTWQPEKIDANTPLPLDEIFSVDDFEI